MMNNGHVQALVVIDVVKLGHCTLYIQDYV